MKKELLFLFCFFLFQITGFSQKLYIKAGAGYNFNPGKNIVSTNVTVQGTNTLSENVEGSYGAGVTKAISVGYMFTPNFGIEVGGSHGVSNKYDFFYAENNYQKVREDSKTYARSTTFNAALVLTTNLAPIKPYLKAGIVAGKPKMFVDSKLMTNDHKFEFAYESSGKTTYGFGSGVGFTYPFSSKWMLFTEGTFTSLSFSPDKSEMTKYYQDGINFLGRVPLYNRETVYKNAVAIDTDPYADKQSKPREQLRSYSPFNAIGVQLGLQFNLY
ncbi:outer membrane beta-barrel protein [Adhaeribacter radiodurans]|uniref:Outer membrane beta-barrel protein n=1 Tax=Adhaeribacter radiodurans TaxID=2745197 RepID=A0A7L7LDG8_9BACT|nr:outer membrane beta-barrel protein [Adhaeribacter radiodurans]QMU30823.1 outer membrane beta-barrel protein [Adhaeribacter radiodurans]